MVEAGRDSWRSSGPMRCSSRATSSLLPRVIYRHLFNFSRNRCSIVLLGNLCQCSVTLTIEKVLPGVQMESSVFQFIASSPVTGHHCKEPVKRLLLQAEQSYLSEPFHLREMLQSHHLLGIALFDCTQCIYVSLVLERQALYEILQVWSYNTGQCSDNFSQPTPNTTKKICRYVFTEKQLVGKCNLKSEKI